MTGIVEHDKAKAVGLQSPSFGSCFILINSRLALNEHHSQQAARYQSGEEEKEAQQAARNCLTALEI